MISAIAHKITAFVLVFILFAQNINTLVIVGDFMVNQAMIAKTLCVQKDNQQGCNGKCHLSKQIKQSSPDSNTDVPLQETRGMSLDAFCLFQIQTSNNQVILFVKHLSITGFYSQSILQTYLDIDTPPPNFI